MKLYEGQTEMMGEDGVKSNCNGWGPGAMIGCMQDERLVAERMSEAVTSFDSAFLAELGLRDKNVTFKAMLYGISSISEANPRLAQSALLPMETLISISHHSRTKAKELGS